jgi:enoyl-CoA hydratase/carnithine racemase
MPNWKSLLDECTASGSTYDLIRRKYLFQLHESTGRNVIAYYSGWLQKTDLARAGFSGFEVNDSDKNGLMAVIHEMDRTKGLDLILHTPGGEISATESLVDYLRSMFGTDIRAIIPQLAMSAGTMISLACKQIVMGKHSSLGPIDPQIGGVPAHGIIEEFERAKAEVQANQLNALLWQPIVSKYNPTLIGECEKAIAWATEISKEWLVSGMFQGHVDAAEKAEAVVAELGSHALTKSHGRHISLERAASIGLNVHALERDGAFQEAVLTVHHAYVQTLSATSAAKIIENHRGVAHISGASDTQFHDRTSRARLEQ